MRTIKLALIAGAVAMMTTGAVAQGAGGGGAVSSPASGPNAAVDSNNPYAPANQPRGGTTGMSVNGGATYSGAVKAERGKSGDANTQRPASDNMSK
jgi:hypothetical protein